MRSLARDLDDLGFVPLTSHSTGVPAFEYLASVRGWAPEHVAQAAERFWLRYNPRTRCLVIPHLANGHLVHWTERTIESGHRRRYRSMDRYRPEPPDDQAQRFTVYDADAVCAGGAVLFICEGPLDAIALWLAGADLGVVATALFGAWASPIQLALLRGVRSLYQRVFVLLDADAVGQGLGLAGQLGVGAITLSVVDDDPAKMSFDDRRRLIAYAAESDEQHIRWSPVGGCPRRPPQRREAPCQ